MLTIKSKLQWFQQIESSSLNCVHNSRMVFLSSFSLQRIAILMVAVIAIFVDAQAVVQTQSPLDNRPTDPPTPDPSTFAAPTTAQAQQSAAAAASGAERIPPGPKGAKASAEAVKAAKAAEAAKASALGSMAAFVAAQAASRAAFAQASAAADDLRQQASLLQRKTAGAAKASRASSSAAGIASKAASNAARAPAPPKTKAALKAASKAAATSQMRANASKKQTLAVMKPAQTINGIAGKTAMGTKKAEAATANMIKAAEAAISAAFFAAGIPEQLQQAAAAVGAAPHDGTKLPVVSQSRCPKGKKTRYVSKSDKHCMNKKMSCGHNSMPFSVVGCGCGCMMDWKILVGQKCSVAKKKISRQNPYLTVICVKEGSVFSKEVHKGRVRIYYNDNHVVTKVPKIG